MKLVGLMPLRNEAWVAGLSLRVALLWCDEIVVLLHDCTDAAPDIVEDVIREHDRGRVHVLRASGEWHEMQHRQMMLEQARAKGATHIAIVDADEILTGNLLQRNGFGQGAYFTRDGLQPGQMLLLPGYNLRNGITKYHTNGIWSDRWFSLAFRDDPRLSWSGDNFHSREPRGIAFLQHRPIAQGEGGVMHLWGASERRLRAKTRFYKITERLRWPNKSVALIEKMYDWSAKDRPEVYGVTPEQWTFATVPETWWKPYAKWMKHLDIDSVPWQEHWCDKMIAYHGRALFAGLSV